MFFRSQLSMTKARLIHLPFPDLDCLMTSKLRSIDDNLTAISHLLHLPQWLSLVDIIRSDKVLEALPTRAFLQLLIPLLFVMSEFCYWGQTGLRTMNAFYKSDQVPRISVCSWWMSWSVSCDGMVRNSAQLLSKPCTNSWNLARSRCKVCMEGTSQPAHTCNRSICSAPYRSYQFKSVTAFQQLKYKAIAKAACIHRTPCKKHREHDQCTTFSVYAAPCSSLLQMPICWCKLRWGSSRALSWSPSFPCLRNALR
jgi:hypothetical protein